MESEIFVGKDFNLLSQLLSAAAAGPVDIKTSYYKFLLIQEEEVVFEKQRKSKPKSSLLLFTPGSLGIKLLDWGSTKGYWCLISERWFIQYTHLKLVTINPLFREDTDQVLVEKPDHRFERLFGIMYREYESGNSQKYDAIFNCIALVLREAIKRLPANTRENEYNAAAGLFQAFLYLLEERFRKSDCSAKAALVDPAYFADILSVETDYLNKTILVMSGRTIRELINEQVMGKANRLLKTSDSSVSEIADQLGFDSPAQFKQLYKKNMGITPLTYRKNTRPFLPKIS